MATKASYMSERPEDRVLNDNVVWKGVRSVGQFNYGKG